MSTAAVILDLDPELVWDALVALLADQLGEEVDVDAIGVRDFDENDELTVRCPAARVVFSGDEAMSFEMQGQNYDLSHEFGVICADQDLRDPHSQRRKALRLARNVKRIVIGARLALATGQTTEPVIYRRMVPLTTVNVGLAYVAMFTVPGIAQFPAPNANPSQGGQ